MRILLLCLICLAANAALKAQRILKGKVTEAISGLPIPGATIKGVGTGIHTQTDLQGAYTINLPTTADAITVSQSGFRAKKLAILSSGMLNVTLTADVQLFKAKGNVVDASNGKPLAGASVLYLRGQTSALTDDKGMFTQSMPGISGIFKVSRDGYKDLMLTLRANETNTVRLERVQPEKPTAPATNVSTAPMAPQKKTEPAPKKIEGKTKIVQVQEASSVEKQTAVSQKRPWWEQAQYMVPIIVACIAGIFSLLQTWLTQKK